MFLFSLAAKGKTRTAKGRVAVHFAHFWRDFKHFQTISEPFLLSRGMSQEIKVTVIRHSSGI